MLPIKDHTDQLPENNKCTCYFPVVGAYAKKRTVRRPKREKNCYLEKRTYKHDNNNKKRDS